MAGRYAANCKISSPITVHAQPDIDFNGLMFSYTIGLMFPPQAAYTFSATPVAPPTTPGTNVMGTTGIL